MSRHALRMIACITVVVIGSGASAQVVVPGAADSSRLHPEEQLAPPPEKKAAPRVLTQQVLPTIAAPQGAEAVHFILRGLTLRGVTVFGKDDFAPLYEPLLGHEISLAQVYELTAQITQRYRNAGYLLSYAYVPDQQIAQGTVVIAIAEGYISHVTVEGEDPNSSITQKYAARITAQRPLRDRTLESALLRLDDLPGCNYRAVLSKEAGASPEEAILTLVPTAKSGHGMVGFDNFSSRYLGPNEVSGSYANSFLPRQQTTLFGLASLPFDRLNYVSLNHAFVAAPDITLEATGSYTRSAPGYTLSNLDINSATSSYSIGANYQWIRQRSENLLLKFLGESRHVASDVFGNTPLTREDIRMAHATVSYDRLDNWGGENNLNAVITQGIDGLGSSKAGDINLSRGKAVPDFTKLELSVSRLQAVTDDWAMLVRGSAQVASDPLYASEQYGYGGQAFGRGYDSSEIIGDEGASAMAEIRYTGLRTLQPVNFEPYLFMDTGVVTNRDTSQKKRDSLTSAGGGVRFATIWGQTGMLGLAFPLARDASAPIYGQDSDGPRIMLQIAHNF